MKLNEISDLSIAKTILADNHTRIHYGQFAEDSLIIEILRLHSKNFNTGGGFYVDVGSHHPRHDSNTYLLNKIYGYRGINIHANQTLIDAFQNERPNDINICAAVSDVEEEVTFHVFNHPGVSSIDPEVVGRISGKDSSPFRVTEERSMTTRRLESILNAHITDDIAIDLLNIDVEGVDFKVLKSNNWEKYRPVLVCVEDHTFDMRKISGNEINNYMMLNGYFLASRGYCSSFYLNNR
jgi:FkbM family methyltransferase